MLVLEAQLHPGKQTSFSFQSKLSLENSFDRKNDSRAWATDIFEVLSSYNESDSSSSENSFMKSSEDDYTEISSDRDFVVSYSESLVYTESRPVSSDQFALEEPNSEYNATAVNRASEVT